MSNNHLGITEHLTSRETGEYTSLIRPVKSLGDESVRLQPLHLCISPSLSLDAAQTNGFCDVVLA